MDPFKETNFPSCVGKTSEAKGSGGVVGVWFVFKEPKMDDKKINIF